MRLVLSLTAAAGTALIVRVVLFHLIRLGERPRSETRGVVAEIVAVAVGATIAVVLFSGEAGSPSTALMAAVTAAGFIVLGLHRLFLARRQHP